MGEPRRALCEANIYHVVIRGVGRQVVFEDDDDRCLFLDLLAKELTDRPVELYAWCLMSNHAHLLLHAPMKVISPLMNALDSTYARLFNNRHGHTGHLFEGRFYSEAIEDDSQLLTVVRYIHQNPWKAGIAISCDYAWSSYCEYLGLPHITQTCWILGLFGGKEAFRSFHDFLAAGDSQEERRERRHLTDEAAREIAVGLLGKARFKELKAMPKEERDKSLRRLKGAGLSVRCIERMTGVGRGIVARA